MTDNGHGMHLGFVVEVVQGDALTVPADVLGVKHAPRSGGLGAQMRRYLQDDEDMLPQVGEYRIWPAGEAAKAEYILMVGTGPIFTLRYPQLRDLGQRFLDALWEAGLDVKHFVTTIHGVRTGVGLDEIEAFRSLLLGMADAYESGRYPPTLERITFVEKDARRAEMLQGLLGQFLSIDLPAPGAPAAKEADARRETGTSAIMAGPESFELEFRKPEADDSAPHIFVAMPFRDAYDDQYYLAIQPAVHDRGLLCERMDFQAFTGDIVDRMLNRIRSAELVIALLDGGNPNVYLEVGYAWGVQTSTILIAHEGEQLPFDVRGHRVLIYDRIYRLKEMLAAELKRLQNQTGSS